VKRETQSLHNRSPSHDLHTAHCVGNNERSAAGRRSQCEKYTASIYCPLMPEPDTPTARDLDPQAAARVLRRLAGGDDAPWLHAEVARRMAQRLSIIKLQPVQVLDWWGFLGGGGAALGRQYPRARRVVVEPMPVLQQRTMREPAAPWWSARRWRGDRADLIAEGDEPAGTAQLLWANMMLHAARDPAAVMSRWHRALAVEGFVMFSCAGPDTLKELHALYRRLGWPTPGAALVDMHDLGDMMLHAGFAGPVMDQELLTLTWTDAPALLAELRTLGGNVSPQRHAALRTPRWRDRLSSELAALAGPNGRIAMSFEIIYGHAFKPAPRVRMSGETVVPVDDLRAMARAHRR
jgi:malonyl-CoA O-methyltransferase